ncbi:MAG: glycosyltransferase family 2 protein [Phycisphaerales bacterium]|nr:MAG: glycosyltransferase family 2 protein [Phycisphaerales bacterium]
MLLWISAGIGGLFLLQTILNWVLVPELAKLTPRAPVRWPFVSIVVPAHNEERAVGQTVSSYRRQDYEEFEVIVVDDESTDNTPHILRELQAQHANLTVISGSAPPEGWLGKPNALQIGLEAAEGEWILFVDADVTYAPDLLRRAMAYVLEQDYGMLVVWPRYVTEEVLEAVAMCSPYLVIFSAFPLFMVPRSRRRWLSTGNGTFNLVRRDTLEDCNAFESLKAAVFDDFALGFKVKGAGHSVAVAASGPLVQIRMYHGFKDMLSGLTKNVYHVAGRVSPLLMPFGFLLARP